jgi:hypothetical protein
VEWLIQPWGGGIEECPNLELAVPEESPKIVAISIRIVTGNDGNNVNWVSVVSNTGQI